MHNQRLLPLFLAAAVALPSAVLASGNYTSRPPKPPTGKSSAGVKMDSERYELGKRIYNGKLKLGSPAPATATMQETRLRALQLRLPEREQKSANLTELAGKLSAEQLDALEYYVNRRFENR